MSLWTRALNGTPTLWRSALGGCGGRSASGAYAARLAALAGGGRAPPHQGLLHPLLVVQRSQRELGRACRRHKGHGHRRDYIKYKASVIALEPARGEDSGTDGAECVDANIESAYGGDMGADEEGRSDNKTQSLKS